MFPSDATDPANREWLSPDASLLERVFNDGSMANRTPKNGTCVEPSRTIILESTTVTEATLQSAVDISVVREILARHGRLTIDVTVLDEDFDLYGAGLTSLATVGIMLALEDRFDVEFPESMLSRSTFRSVSAIADAVSRLVC